MFFSSLWIKSYLKTSFSFSFFYFDPDLILKCAALQICSACSAACRCASTLCSGGGGAAERLQGCFRWSSSFCFVSSGYTVGAAPSAAFPTRWLGRSNSEQDAGSGFKSLKGGQRSEGSQELPQTAQILSELNIFLASVYLPDIRTQRGRMPMHAVRLHVASLKASLIIGLI